MEVGGISAYMNIMSTWNCKGYPLANYAPARVAPWSKTPVTRYPTSALCLFCSFSHWTSPGLTPLTECLLTTGTYYEHL